MILIITIIFFAAAYLHFSLKTIIKSEPPSIRNRLLYFLAVCLIPLTASVFLKLSGYVLRYLRKLVAHHFISHAVIIAMTVLPRTVWILLVQAEPQSDFRSYHLVASAIARGQTVLENYISVFPHVIGYPYVLSFFYKLFGSHVLVAQLANILFSCGIAVMVYRIGTEFMDGAGAFLAAAIWVLWPSQVFYTLLVVSETVYTFMVLVFMYFFLKAASKKEAKSYFTKLCSFAVFLSLGGLLSLCSAIRPFGPILLIACAIYYFIIPRPGLKNLKLKVPLYITMVFGYMLLSSLINSSISAKIGRSIAARPIGFNLYVGLNSNHAGSWNGSDAREFGDLMRNADYSAQDIHNTFLQKAISRVKENGRGNIRLLVRKFSVIWCGDADPVIYINSAKDPDEMSLLDISRYLFPLSNLCNFYYHASLLLAATGCLALIKKLPADGDSANGNAANGNAAHSKAAIFLPLIYLWGIICVHCITEVAGRYHYPVIPVFSLLAAYAPYYMAIMEKRRKGTLSAA
jgi:hypothetical protein